MAGLACVQCRVFLVPKRSGVYIEEGMPLSDDRDGPWGPYKLWAADLSECPRCGFQLIHGFGRKALSEHFMPEYAQRKEVFPPMVRIDACTGHKP